MGKRMLGILLMIAASGATAAEKRDEVTQAFPFKAGKVVMVESGALDISLRVADIPEIRVHIEIVAGALSQKAATAWVDAHRATITDGEDELRITAPDPSGVKLFKGVIVTRARIELVVPPGTRPDLSTSSGTLRVDGEMTADKPVRLRTASGDLEFAGWVRELEARSTSGDIDLRASRAIDRMFARSASGSVRLQGGARTLRCDTSSGNVRAEGLLGGVGIATTSGNVLLRFDALAAGDLVSVTTTSGKVRITLPPASAPAGELMSARGQIHSVYPGEVDAKGGKLKLAGTASKVVVTTTSGLIDLS